LADILMRGDLRDDDLANRVITVTEVDVSPDLRNATVYVMPLGGRDVDITLAALKRAAPYLRGEVARRVRLRTAPQLRFLRDERFDTAERVEKILRSPAVAHDLEDEPKE
jgi:ribosome-binding factor A